MLHQTQHVGIEFIEHASEKGPASQPVQVLAQHLAPEWHMSFLIGICLPKAPFKESKSRTGPADRQTDRLIRHFSKVNKKWLFSIVVPAGVRASTLSEPQADTVSRHGRWFFVACRPGAARHELVRCGVGDRML